MTYEIEHHTGEFQTYTAGGTITAGMLVTLNATGGVEAAGTSATNVIGVADEAATSGDTVRVASGYLIVYLKSAAAITAGANLETAADGTVDDTSGTGMTLQSVAFEAATGAAEWIRAICNFPCFV